MISQEKRLFCRLDGLTTEAREQQRLKAITELGLLQAESIPVFEEATQAAAQTLSAPICYLSLMEPDRERLKAAIGLSRLGLMNELATTRQLPRLDAFSTYVVDSQNLLIIEDTLAHPAFANSHLVHQYEVRSFIGVPLVTASGCCIGALMVMDITPRNFTTHDAEFLLLMARWSISEYERSRLMQQLAVPVATTSQPHAEVVDRETRDLLRVDLLSYLAQELRTPLTSVMGMASVLTREIYGPLTSKQKEYLNIIHNSGQYLLSLMNEIIELAEFKETNQNLNLSSVDIEMLCQQSINTLEHAAQRREQKIRLTVEPSRRIWLVDKEKVRQMLYHLMFSVIQSSAAGSIVRLHVSRREHELNLTIWVSHPWLGEGLPYVEVYSDASLVGANRVSSEAHIDTDIALEAIAEPLISKSTEKATISRETPRKNLGVLLSQQLAELHKGQVLIQGSAETGFRYVISLPRLMEPVEG
jgi:hypothetical protein